MKNKNFFLAALALLAAQGLWADVLISEFTYDAKKPFKSDDWVEICNYGATAVDISGWQLGDDKYDEGGTLYTVPDGTTLEPNACVVFYSDAAFTDIYPEVGNILGPTGIGFGKGEDAVVLLNADGEVEHKIEYATIDEGGEWPDGSAYSNVLVFPYADYNNTWQTWNVSEDQGGSPGTKNAETSGLYVSKHSRNPNAPTSVTAPEIHIWAYDADAADKQVQSAKIFYSTSENGTYEPVNMTLSEGNEWVCSLPVMAEGTTVFYYALVEGADGTTLRKYWNAFRAPYMYVVTNDPVYSGIVINEIMYQCLDTAYTNTKGNCKNYEYVELFNKTQDEIDLSYWRFEVEKEKYRLPSGTTLEPGEFLLITDRKAAIETVYALPAGAQIFEFDFGLSNSGDTISIQNANGQEVDSVTYKSTAPWPTGCAGLGPSLELTDPNADNSLPASWGASIAIYGTPCDTNSVPEPAFALVSLLALAAVCLKR
ncbi:lamin tail domain-containing protein [bacterium]|nr:lamin tail domain-containing protein [bacterium]